MGLKVLCCMVTLCIFLRQGSTERPTACSDHKSPLDIFSDTLVKRLLELFSVTTDIEDTEDTEGTEDRVSVPDGQKCPAGTFYNAISKECEPCSPGSFSKANANVCTPCPEGTYNNRKGLRRCFPCEAGTFANKTGSRVCVECAPGTFTDATKSASCTPCRAGQYSGPGATTCTASGPDTHPDEPKQQCITDPICYPGEYRDVDGSCAGCPAGSFSTEVNSTTCTPCPVGHYNSRTNQTSCLECSPGTFSDTPGSEICEGCRAGQYNADTASDSCSNCIAGTYSTENASSCVPCPGGTFSPVSGSEICTDCDAGSFSRNGSTTCTVCVPGTFSGRPGSTSCEPCAAGSSQDKPGQTLCSLCSPGTSTKGWTARSHCFSCSPGQFASGMGWASCGYCPPGSSTNKLSGSISCSLCIPGYFSSVAGSPGCQGCPVGQFNDRRGSASCATCNAGSSTGSSQGSTNCTLCPAGHFAESEGSPLCEQCKPGSYQDQTGQTGCNLCGRGTYQEKRGGVQCTFCANNRTYTTYSTGSTSGDDCKGPLLNYTVAGKLNQLRDVSNVTVWHSSTILLSAVSGDWVVRNPEHPYTKFLIIKQGEMKFSPEGIKEVILEPMMTNIFCYKDTEGHGVYFSGYQNKDVKGRECEGPCRNTEGLEIGPHCQVNNETSPCGLPRCVWDVQCSAGDGTGYRGLVNSAKVEGNNTIPCQAWNKDYPHVHTYYHPTSYNTATYGLGKHSFCRNPDPGKSVEPWCYTTDYWIRYGPCFLPACDTTFQYFQL
ncbi:major surface trophozoite antigen 11-like [Bolinopsis microptera]|uniref:major surface trophozoite antigen 11-like n=1 Tax=Bolinopsis microptera TaxID=2820187 RepID=UPI00307A416F